MANSTNKQQPAGTMSSGAAVMGFLIAFLGGLLIGHLTGRTAGGGEELAIGNSAEGAAAAAVGAAAPGADDVQRLRIDVTNQMPQRGPADALVTIAIFSEFQCPFCSRVNPTIEQIEREYGNRVRIVWRDNPLPFHDNAKPAAEAAREAFAQGGSEKFWAMHAILFQNQSALTRPDLERYATQIGLNMDRFRRALDSHTHQAAIEADVAAAARVGARGTPAFHINGRQLMGAQPFESFKTVIDDEIRRSQALVAHGTRPAQLYATLMRGARADAAPEAPAAAPAAQPQPDPNAVYNVPVGTSPVRGPADALVTLVIISDYQCPFCSRVEATYNQVSERYGRDVRFVWKDNPLPFHDNAKPAAEAAREVFAQGGAAKFWQYHDLLFQNQTSLARADLERFAEQVGGINMGRFRTALDSHTHQAAIDADMQLAAARGARGTPATFINGRFLSGAQPFEAFQRVVDEELAKARTRVEAGTPRARVYDAIIATGATAQVMLPGAAGAPAAAAEPAEDPNRVYNIPVPANAITKGPASARVTIQIFSDYQCPFCSRVEPTLHTIEERYGSRVRFVWRDYPLPFHNNAMPAAQAGREVFAQGGAAKFWQYHDLLFQNQTSLARADLERFAEQVGGINMARFRAALDNNTHQAVIQADMNAVQTAGAQIGTPSFFINGRLLQGAQPVEQFTQAIDRALAP